MLLFLTPIVLLVTYIIIQAVLCLYGETRDTIKQTIRNHK